MLFISVLILIVFKFRTVVEFLSVEITSALWRKPAYGIENKKCPLQLCFCRNGIAVLVQSSLFVICIEY